MVMVESTERDTRHVLVSWLPPNELTNMRIISRLHWQGGRGHRASVEVVFFYCCDVQFPREGPLANGSRARAAAGLVWCGSVGYGVVAGWASRGTSAWVRVVASASLLHVPREGGADLEADIWRSRGGSRSAGGMVGRPSSALPTRRTLPLRIKGPPRPTRPSRQAAPAARSVATDPAFPSEPPCPPVLTMPPHLPPASLGPMTHPPRHSRTNRSSRWGSSAPTRPHGTPANLPLVPSRTFRLAHSISMCRPTGTRGVTRASSDPRPDPE